MHSWDQELLCKNCTLHILHVIASYYPWKENTITRDKTNVATENRPSQKESSLPSMHFQVLC